VQKPQVILTIATRSCKWKIECVRLVCELYQNCHFKTWNYLALKKAFGKSLKVDVDSSSSPKEWAAGCFSDQSAGVL